MGNSLSLRDILPSSAFALGLLIIGTITNVIILSCYQRELVYNKMEQMMIVDLEDVK